MSETRLTADQVFETITGREEVAVRERFERPIADLLANEPTMWGRALLFVLIRREGTPDGEAFDAAMDMPLSGVNGSFVDPTPEEAGKGEESPSPSLSSASDQEPETQPTSSLTSAS